MQRDCLEIEPTLEIDSSDDVSVGGICGGQNKCAGYSAVGKVSIDRVEEAPSRSMGRRPTADGHCGSFKLSEVERRWASVNNEWVNECVMYAEM